MTAMNADANDDAMAPSGEARVRAVRWLADRMAAGGCDLHLHTRHSDGSETPEQLVHRAMERGLKTIAITDHDSIAAIEQARLFIERVAAGRRTAHVPLLVPGIELSVEQDGEERHLLGYFPAGGIERLQTFLVEQADSRQRRNVIMLSQLSDLGYPIDPEQFAASGDGSLGRLQAAILLCNQGYFHSIEEAFDRLLAEGQPGYVGRIRPDACTAIDEIHRAGGVAVLAHPALYGWCGGQPVVSRQLIDQLASLKHCGLDGVEAYHGEAGEAEQKEIAAAARLLDLLCTAGSDDHGANKDHARMYDATSFWPDRHEILVVGALCTRVRKGSDPVYLLGRRQSDGRHAGFWELPGGKVEPGENPRQALVRELSEELSVDATAGELAALLVHDYPDDRVILAVYRAECPEQVKTSRAHDRLAWVRATQALTMNLLPADIVLFRHLI